MSIRMQYHLALFVLLAAAWTHAATLPSAAPELGKRATTTVSFNGDPMMTIANGKPTIANSDLNGVGAGLPTADSNGVFTSTSGSDTAIFSPYSDGTGYTISHANAKGSAAGISTTKAGMTALLCAGAVSAWIAIVG